MTTCIKQKIQELDRNRAYAGRFLLRFDVLESTNSFCLETTSVLKRPGLAVIANHQTGGRGSRGRTWEPGRGRHLFCSLVIHPPIQPELFPAMTLFAGLSVFRVLEDLGAGDLAIKWPNDVLIQGRKVCGILCESRNAGDARAVVVGIGINISGDHRQFPRHLWNRLTTLEEHGINISRLELMDRIAGKLDNILKTARGCNAKSPDVHKIFRQWEAASSSIGREVEFQRMAGDKYTRGIIAGLDSHGRLLVRTGNGELARVLSGQVRYL